MWTTDRRGPVTVSVDAWVAPSGPSGALEYDFGVVPTPITTVSLGFPRPDVAPQLEHAVTVARSVEGGATRVVANLERTDRVTVRGLRELEPTSSLPPKLYAETTHLLAVDERELELFTVVRYDILYAPAHRFEVFVPEGLRVVSADGEGAFTYQVVPDQGGVRVVGETASPMRAKYELSLELARELPEGATRFVLPSARGVERESGWVGVEAPGRVQLEPITVTTGLAQVPVVELPDELRTASVSPLLEGFRLVGEASLELGARALPEVEARTERIDEVRARTVVSSNGRAQTEVVVTMRNRMAPGLVVELPEGATLARALRDGEVVTPSRASDGRIVVPLRRSAPDLPLTVQLVLEQDLGAPGWIGWLTLSLPAFDLPAAEVTWEVAWPDGHWSEPVSAVPTQAAVGYGTWLADQTASHAALAPAQVELHGIDASYARYWVPPREEITLRATALPWGVVAMGRVGVALAWMFAVPAALAALGWRLYSAVRRT
ncbi:MAG: hypothetical protein ABMA64_38240 [Myxococcota bacterium]